MERVFTRKCGRYDRGDVRDWPKLIWRRVAESLGMPMEKFSAPVEEVAQAAIPKPGRPRKEALNHE